MLLTVDVLPDNKWHKSCFCLLADLGALAAGYKYCEILILIRSVTWGSKKVASKDSTT